MPRRKTKEEIILGFEKAHGGKYDYSLVNYVNQNTNVDIICSVHGVFKQRPQHHGNGSGCTKCANNMRSVEDFVLMFREIHGERYDYSMSKPSSTKHNIDIVCREHGVFSQLVSNHMRGSGCLKCCHADFASKQIKPFEKHILDFKEVHGDRYDYSNTKIGLSRDKCVVECPKHGKFKVTPKNHMAGHGCPYCSNSGFDISKDGFLYVLEVVMLDGRIFHKIGVTNKGVRKRYSKKEMVSILSYSEYYFGSALDALEMEGCIKAKFKSRACNKSNYPLISGYTECFDLGFSLGDHVESLINS